MKNSKFCQTNIKFSENVCSDTLLGQTHFLS